MIFRNRSTQKNGSQKLANISLTNGKSNELWSELDETSQAAINGGISFDTGVVNTTFSGNFAGNVGGALSMGALRLGLHVQALP